MVRNRFVRRVLGVAAGGVLAICGTVATAQVDQPAFVDDAPVARDTLRGLGDLIARGGRPEAARALQRLLDAHGARVIASEDDPTLYVSVRDAVHARLLADGALLRTYAEVHEPRAAALLSAGDAATVESALLLTPSGFEAALRVAQDHLESARFAAAWRTLERLRIHPDATDAGRAREAFEFARLAAAYPVDGVDVEATLSAWAGLAGVDRAAGVGAVDPIEPPARVLLRASGPLTGGPEVDVSGVVPRALSTMRLPGADGGAPAVGRGARGGRRDPPLPRAIPIIVDDRVYANDGVVVSAWDRFTLRPLWSVAPSRGAPPSGMSSTGSRPAGSVAFAGPTLIAATSGEVDAARGGSPTRVHAIDRETGAVVWSVNPASADERLESAAISGPVVVAGDTALVPMRKSVRSRRLISEWLVGVSVADGSVRWVTLLSSAGSLPYQQSTAGQRMPTVSGGVVFRDDELGVLAAVDAASGRPIWVRLLPEVDARRRRNTALDLIPSSPAVFGDRVFVLSADGSRVLSFDARTGAPGPVNDLGALGPFGVLIRLGDRLAVFSRDRAVVLDPAAIERDPERLVRFEGPRRSPAGIPTAVGGTLLVPVAAGVLTFDPGRGVERLIELDAPGHTAAADGQLIVAAGDALHTYLAWETASAVLARRLEENPNDPAPPTTFAELAFATGRHDRIMEAADDALAALRRVADAERAEAARARLFDTLRTMVEHGDGLSGARGPGGAGAAGVSSGPAPITDTSLLAGLLDRLAGLAVTEGERVGELLARGRFAEASGRPLDALEAYQRVLVDEGLSAANWRGAGLSVRAELEATRRLTALLEAQRPGLYDPFDAEALVRLDAAGPNAPAGEIERIARAYPASVHAVGAWRRAAEAHARAGRPHDAVRAARTALDAAETVGGLGRRVDAGEVGAAASWLLARFIASERLDEAAVLVDGVRRAFPEATIAVPDAAARSGLGDPAALLADVRRRLAEARRHPALGPAATVTATPRVIGGYLLEPTLSLTGDGSDLGRSWADGALVTSAVSGELAFIEPDGAGDVRARWTTLWPTAPVLLRRDAGTAWLLTADLQGRPTVHRVSLGDGAVIWSTPAWDELIGGVVSADPAVLAGDGPSTINMPDGSSARFTQVVVAGDARTIVLVERTGRAVAIDASVGRPLWRAAMPVTRVQDADVREGTLLLTGLGPAPGDPGEFAGLVSVVDAVSGAIVATREVGEEGARWARLARGGRAVIADDLGIAALDAATGGQLWRLNDERFAGSEDALLTDDRAFIRRDDGRFALIDLTGGRVIRETLADRGRLVDAERLRVVERPSGGLTVSSDRGLIGFNADGGVVALDALGAGEGAALQPAAFGAEIAVTVQTRTASLPGDRSARFTLHAMDRSSGRLRASWPLVLYGLVRRIEVIDGFALVGVGEAVVAYPFPSEGD